MAVYRFPWWRIVLGLVLVLALLITLLPLAVQTLTLRWLERQGLQAEFGYLGFSPLRGTLSLQDLRGRSERGDGFAVQRLLLDIAWTGLLDGRLQVENIELEGVQLDIAVTGGLRVGGIDIDALEATAEPAPPPDETRARPWTLQVERFGFRDLSVCYRDTAPAAAPPLHLCGSLVRIGSGAPVVAQTGAGPRVTFDGELVLAGLELRDLQVPATLLQLDTLSVQGGSLTAEQMTLARLELANLALAGRDAAAVAAQDNPFHLKLRRLLVAGIDRSTAVIAVKHIELDGPDMLLHRTRTGEMPLQVLVTDLASPGGERTPEADTKTTPEGAPAAGADGSADDLGAVGGDTPDAAPTPDTALVIDRVSLSDGKLLLLDESTPTPVRKSLRDITVSIEGLDSRAPGRPATLSLSAGLDEFGTMAVDGTVKPFAEALEVTLSGSLTAVNLLPFSGYMEQAIGYRIVSGQFSDQFRLAIADNQIDAVTELALHKLDINRLKAATAGEGSTESGLLPIGVALDLLREDDDRIALKLPVRGDLHDPDFSLTDVTTRVARKALTEAVINYYTPFGLVSLGSMLVSSATRLRFAPLEYAPGEVEPDEGAAERLQQLSQLLQKKKRLNLVFCPLATGPDRAQLYPDDHEGAAADAQVQRLRQLAQQRGEAAKRRLLALGVASEQVVLCSPAFDPDPALAPQVRISL
ncbi:DUF748 domain-containing protein [Exilibacterium tricleocarpae]|uniref:DUF748 domain-containing protein n=1 Tax=Exilibacterium tricleocarpae TaxID=2591008 RepID=A0A545TFS3_9GAMM|nr:DUF748 domain-containing protein [Exilibacterium tricleocarpae]TQV76070.1 DUF748 domain-containing protein [Exilibacterium tricleocarpae]